MFNIFLKLYFHYSNFVCIYKLWLDFFYEQVKHAETETCGCVGCRKWISTKVKLKKCRAQLIARSTKFVLLLSEATSVLKCL